MSADLKLSVIIPTLNEADSLPRLLEELTAQKDVRLDIVVADGGSTDGTLDLAAGWPIRCVQAPKGRAIQLNRGSAAARHEQLLFLHADSYIDDDHLLSRALRHWFAETAADAGSANLAGHFPLRFSRSNDEHASAYRFMEHKSASNRPQTINGDQGLLISRAFLTRLGGFNESLRVMEDQDMAQRIFDKGRWILLPGHLRTSARRFETEGFRRRYFLMALMMAFYWSGTHEFFSRARDVYPQQNAARQLRLWPFCKVVWQVFFKHLGPRHSLRQLFKLGRYVRQNSWQLFFWLDTRRSPYGSRRWTRFHDRVVHPFINHAAADVVVTVLVAFFFFLLVSPVVFVADLRREM